MSDGFAFLHARIEVLYIFLALSISLPLEFRN